MAAGVNVPRLFLGLSLLIVLVTNGLCAAADVTLVRDGKSEYGIATPPNPSEAERFAAAELRRYLQAMSGVELAINEWPVNAGPAIIVAEAARLPEELRYGVRDEAFAIACEMRGIGIVGGRGRSLVVGVYRFLDDLGCRWLAPGLDHYRGGAERIPLKPTLTIPTGLHTENPALKFRKLYVEEGLSHDLEGLKRIVEWMPKAGYNALVVPTDYQGSGRVKWDNWREALTPELKRRDLTIEVGGHGYQNFLNAQTEGGRVFREHPEWFGADAKGVRQRSRNRVFCTSNVEAVNFVMDRFLAYVEARPEIEIFDFWPPDGARWCECDECEKLGSPTERQAILVNLIRSVAARAQPGLRIECLAYSTSITPPERTTLHESVLLDFCPISQSFEMPVFDPASARNAEYLAGLNAWRAKFAGDISIYSYYRKYAWNSLPVVLPHYMQRELAFYATVPVQGISTYAEPADWFTYELNHYCLAALAWDPKADVDALVRRFCAARYGNASATAMDALMLLEETTRRYGSIPFTTPKGTEEVRGATDRIVEARRRITESAKAEPSDHLRRLGLMLEYAERDLRIQHSRATKAGENEIRESIESLHAFLTEHAKEGVFLVQRITLPRLLRRYGLETTP